MSCGKPKCEQDCPDVCNDICVVAEVQRGATQTTVALDSNASLSICDPSDERQVTRHLFCFSIAVNNCSGHTINNFRPQLDLTPAFLLESTAVPVQASCTDVVRNNLDNPCWVTSDILASIGEANIDKPGQVGNFNGGLAGPINGCQGDSSGPDAVQQNDGIKLLLKENVRLPPGEARFDVWGYLDVDNENTEQIILQPALFGFTGTIKCCDGTCLPVHKGLLLSCECLPLEDEA